MSPSGDGVRRRGRRARLRAFLHWLLFHRFQLLLALVFVSFPFFSIGPGEALFANLFAIGCCGRLVVAVLALLLGHVLGATAWTSTRCWPLRLWPGMRGRGGAARVESRDFRRAFEVACRARRWDDRLIPAGDERTWRRGRAIPMRTITNPT